MYINFDSFFPGFGDTPKISIKKIPFKQKAGGGLRAMIALHGTLQELQKHGLLDTIMYLCGVSGSTWCMSYLYKNEDWTEKLQALEESMCARLSKYTWSVPKATKLLLEAAKDENYSLTEFWAYTVVYGMLHEVGPGSIDLDSWGSGFCIKNNNIGQGWSWALKPGDGVGSRTLGSSPQENVCTAVFSPTTQAP
uniref:PLA2c domain-containing protein n=1 Tax=Gopherus evgoodei TaxID=1825980 RepID=A0A8C4YBQ6_9SAUR